MTFLDGNKIGHLPRANGNQPKPFGQNFTAHKLHGDSGIRAPETPWAANVPGLITV
ncbi:MAG TPA: hypothetical protein VIL16_16045 [Trebonia sp.]